MKLIAKNYILENEINSEMKICLTSDFHLSNISSDEKFNMVIDSIKKESPNYVCICGDYIDMPNILDDKILYKKSLEYLKKLSKLSKVILVLGNHDFTRRKNGKPSYDLNQKWINDIKKINNFYLIDNDILETRNIRFIGYTYPYDYYTNDIKKEDKSLFIKDFNNKIKPYNKDKYNVLLCHSPFFITDTEVLEKTHSIKNTNLVLCGHMHNGLVPNIIDNLIRNNIGIISPYKRPLPNNARGMKKKNNTTLIVSGAVTKIQETAPKCLQWIDKIYSPQIEYITINKKHHLK